MLTHYKKGLIEGVAALLDDDFDVEKDTLPTVNLDDKLFVYYR
jgi:hypothetical protein